MHPPLLPFRAETAKVASTCGPRETVVKTTTVTVTGMLLACGQSASTAQSMTEELPCTMNHAHPRWPAPSATDAVSTPRRVSQQLTSTETAHCDIPALRLRPQRLPVCLRWLWKPS